MRPWVGPNVVTASSSSGRGFLGGRKLDEIDKYVALGVQEALVLF